MNVVIYARYSSHNQTEQSIEGQLAVCYEYAKRNNYEVVGEYIDRALTGTNDNRPEFKRMIADSIKGFFNGVLVYQLDRFARNRYDSATNKAKLKKNNVRVISAKENITDDASGILMESVLEGMAEYYSAELSQKVKRGMSINAEKCLYNGGTIPLGLRVDEDKRYQIDEKTAPIVRKIFEMYANGEIMADIIRYLNSKNIKTVLGNEFNKCSIHNMLSNKKYIGTYTYNGVETPKAFPAVIEEDLFYRVQDLLKKNKKSPARAKAKAEYLLTTKLFCGECKEMMIGTCGTSKTGKVYNYYACNGVKKKICKKKNVSKEYIEDIVVNEARNILTDENIEKIASEIVKFSEKSSEKSILATLTKRKNEIIKGKNNLLESLKICDIDSVRKTIFEELKKMEDEEKSLEKEIILEESNSIKITYTEIKFFLTEIRKGNINDMKYRKLLINVLIDKVYLYDDSITIIFNAKDKNNTKRVPRIEEIESSFLDNDALPIIRKIISLGYDFFVLFRAERIEL